MKKTLKDADDESTLRGVSRMDVEIQRATKFLQISTDLRQLQKRPEVDSNAIIVRTKDCSRIGLAGTESRKQGEITGKTKTIR